MNEPRRADLSAQPETRKPDQLLQRLALNSGVSLRFMRKFVHEMVTIIEAGLLRDGVVKIHNFGTFRLSRPPTNSDAAKTSRARVIFQPTPGLRALVNQAFGPPLPFGNPISLPALIEKRLAFQSAPPVWAPPEPAVEKIPPQEFDIAEVLPELPEAPPRFDFAETHGEANAPAKQEVEVGELVEAPVNGKQSRDASTHDEPMNGKPVNGKSPIFTFVEPAEEAEPVVAPADSEPDWLAPTTSAPRRKRRFVWYAGAFAIFLLLLLFLLPGRISEKQENASRAVVSTPHSPTENTSSPNGTEATTNGRSPAAPVSTPPRSSVENVNKEIGAPFFAGGVHRVVKGDNLWGLSGNYYRDHYLWPNIYRANSATIKNPDVLEIDQQLELPILHGPAEKLTREDRRHLAEGYFLLYRYYKVHDPALAPFALWAAVRYDERIKSDYAAELREDDLAFLQAHEVRQVAER